MDELEETFKNLTQLTPQERQILGETYRCKSNSLWIGMLRKPCQILQNHWFGYNLHFSGKGFRKPKSAICFKHLSGNVFGRRFHTRIIDLFFLQLWAERFLEGRKQSDSTPELSIYCFLELILGRKRFLEGWNNQIPHQNYRFVVFYNLYLSGKGFGRLKQSFFTTCTWAEKVFGRLKQTDSTPIYCFLYLRNRMFNLSAIILMILVWNI